MCSPKHDSTDKLNRNASADPFHVFGFLEKKSLMCVCPHLRTSGPEEEWSNFFTVDGKGSK